MKTLTTVYPLSYFDKEPVVGSFVESETERYWQDQYGLIDGFGSKVKIDVYVPRFVAPDGPVITELRYPEDPHAFKAYNERYQLYMDSLNPAEPTVTYYRGWDHIFRIKEEQHHE